MYPLLFSVGTDYLRTLAEEVSGDELETLDMEVRVAKVSVFAVCMCLVYTLMCVSCAVVCNTNAILNLCCLCGVLGDTLNHTPAQHQLTSAHRRTGGTVRVC